MGNFIFCAMTIVFTLTCLKCFAVDETVKKMILFTVECISKFHFYNNRVDLYFSCLCSQYHCHTIHLFKVVPGRINSALKKSSNKTVRFLTYQKTFTWCVLVLQILITSTFEFLKMCLFTHSMPLVSFSTPWKHQKWFKTIQKLFLEVSFLKRFLDLFPGRNF